MNRGFYVRPEFPHSGREALVRLPALHTRSIQSECFPSEQPTLGRTAGGSRFRLDRPLYCLLTADGAVCAGQVCEGECLLLFTSPAAASGFGEWTGIETRPPVVFSRSRAEFLAQARRSFGQSFIGGLVDPSSRLGEMVFLGFDVDPRQEDP
jgi:hypothetical protein